MATINYQPPIVKPGAVSAAQPFYYAPPASATAFSQYDFVILSSSQLTRSGDNPSANLVGIAPVAAGATLSQNDTDIQGVFGVTQFGNLMPASPGDCAAELIAPPALVEISLASTNGWVSGGAHQVNLGTGVGIARDATTGYFYADSSLGNIIAHVVDKVVGPNKGIAGDTGARVLIAFDVASALAAVAGA